MEMGLGLGTHLQGLQHGHAVQQLLVHFPLPEGGLQQDAAEGLAIHGPQ